MKQTQINQLTAAETTVSFCETAPSVAATSSITNFAPTVALIKSKIVIVKNYIILGDKPIKGITLNVKDIRASMIEHTYALASAIVAFAASSTPVDKDLIDQAKFSKSYLEDLSKTKCATECDRIRQLASANAAGILGFGVSATDITDTGALVTLYLTGINDPRAAIVSRTSAKKQANLTLKDIMDNLLALQLDTMANTLRFKNAEWWGQYHQSREVIDLGKTFTKLRATITDQLGAPVKNAVASLLQLGVVMYKKKTDIEGKVSIIKIKPGNYDLKVEKTNYVTQDILDLHFAPGSEKIYPVTLPAKTSGTTPVDPPGFVMQDFNIPSGGSVTVPIDGAPPIPGTMQIYLYCGNGTADVCTTNMPASPCTVGFSLVQGVAYLGTTGGLGLDLTKTHLQFTNNGPAEITVRVGALP